MPRILECMSYRRCVFYQDSKVCLLYERKACWFNELLEKYAPSAQALSTGLRSAGGWQVGAVLKTVQKEMVRMHSGLEDDEDHDAVADEMKAHLHISTSDQSESTSLCTFSDLS